MDLFSIWHWLIVGAVLLLLFGGRGRVSELMGDVAKGIKAFKSGMVDTADAQTTTDAPIQSADRKLSADDKQRAETVSEE
ncbi:MAG TPA: twin-arginine translocase TatA/TatE family subunit [Bradyrhizobium sp.]|nr:twin-arginine translocase TatA/TatE family subunit [Bradyrhizobium sp.]